MFHDKSLSIEELERNKEYIKFYNEGELKETWMAFRISIFIHPNLKLHKYF